MKYILYILISFVFCSCSKQKTSHQQPKVSVKITHSLFKDYGIMFVKMDNNKFASTNARHLERVYNRAFSDKYPSFEIFVPDALNQKILFEEEKFKGRNIVFFTLDKNIEKEYRNSGIYPMLEKYCEKGKNDYIFKNKSLPDNEFYTLLYCFFINGNTILFDDVGGFYSIRLSNK